MRVCVCNLFCSKSLPKRDFSELLLLVGKDIISQDKV